ncbi:fungal hydrophobin [Rhizopogon salebrosus TDB-379]|nr:fungal hydrophobin [Rhizopogon salebrosus TDB-379]
MFARFFAVAAVASLAVATPLTLCNGGQCNTGDIKCCQGSTTIGTASQYNALAELFGVVPIIADPEDALNFNCSPFTIVGTGSGATCSHQPVCCSNNNMNGLVNIGCTPINLAL